MTYLELIKRTLDFLSKEDLEKSYYEYWGLNDSDKAIAERKNTAKSEILYLVMEELIANGVAVEPNIYETIKNSLTTYRLNLEKTIKNAYSNAKRIVLEDPETLEIISQIEYEFTDEEEKERLSKELYNKYLNATIKMTYKSLECDEISEPINQIIFHTVTTMPELFFTSKGKKYLPKEYQQSKDLEIKCCQFLKEKLALYEMGDSNCSLDEYDSLYYAAKTLSIIFSIVEQDNYKAFRKLDEINDYLYTIQIKKMQLSGVSSAPDNLKSAIEIIYNTRNIKEFDLKSEALNTQQDNHDKFMDFILNNQELSQTFSNKEIALILFTCYDPYKENPIEDLKNNIPIIKRILESSSNIYQKQRTLKNFSNSKNKEEPPRQFVKK